MTQIASLIANPTAPALDDALLGRLAALLPGAAPPRWLAPGVAADLPFTPAVGADLKGLAAGLRNAASDLAADINILPAAGRRKRLFVADMDSTMIGQECLDELADFVGLREKVAAITARAMRGEIAFEPALRERVALLRGLSADVVKTLLAERITLTPGARTAVATLRAHGCHPVLVSGGFPVVTGAMAERLGFHAHRGNVLEVADGALRGTVAEPILGREAKLAALIESRAALGLRPGETLAVGDGANDLAMLGEAGLGIAFRAKPAVAAAAAARIEHGDLTALLYLQGYRRDEFAA
jgi:phosphoserine phosphatase